MNISMDVSVIIVNYNTRETTKKCLDSIFEYTKDILFEVILVDNASKDGSAEFFARDSRINLIKSEINLGFGKANNLGLRYATGKYIFLLNSDTLLLNNAIKEFYDAHENMGKNVACLGCILKAEDGVSENNSYGIFPSLSTTWHNILYLYFRWGTKSLKFDDGHSSDFRVDYIIGADLFIRREVIDHAGLFDPDFFMYFEESEMQFRYSKYGYESRIIRTPSIIHLECVSVGGGRKMPSLRQRMMYFQGMFLYMRKRYGALRYLLFRIIILMYLPTFRKMSKSGVKDVVKLFFLTA